ncbi:MAG: alpha-glucosidase [Pseudobutyrivibrio sp.]|nr:alpha-glucosidase [Pseudobutyrivibrio sp.]
MASNKKWWKNSICYQIYPRSFCDSNGDGIGDIPGIISKLHYLKELGVDIIWLCPVYPSPNHDNGYDISDYTAINPEFGTMDDMDKLISRAKRLGIKIIMDLVINHTSDEHEWFKRALAGDEEYKDFYYFRKGNGNKKPNNWKSFFGGDAWQKVGDDEYYLHLFSEHQPDLNWHNPKVYEKVSEIMRFWLDKGIYGFRCDVINIIYKQSLEDGATNNGLVGMEHYLNTEGCHELLARFNKEIWSKYKTFVVGETVAVTPEDMQLLCSEHRGELDLGFFFEHMDVDSRGSKWYKKKYYPNCLIKILDKWQNSVDYTANYLENHDQIRSVNHFGDTEKFWRESATMLCGMNLSLKGMPFIYQGQEIGMTNGDFTSIEELRDVESYNAEREMAQKGIIKCIRRKLVLNTSRDNARTPMQWDNSEKAGFTDGEPWLKINSNKSFINVEAEQNDENSVLNFYRKMIDYRRNSKALTEGTYRKVAGPRDVYIFTREAPEERLYVYCNMTSNVKEVEFYGDTIVFGNYKKENRTEKYLLPYEFRIVKSNI